MNNEVKTPQNGTSNAQGKGKTRKQYRKPLLTLLGDLRNLTLGGSAGILDSGPGNDPEVTKPFV